MLKKIFSILIMILLLIGLSKNVFAKDTFTTTSTINGVTVNWEYELNDSNQIENLKCNNPNDLTGNITVPATLEGKTIISIKYQAFKSSSNITGVTIPNSIKEINFSAFEGCSNLSEVNLGGITSIGANTFKDCPKLTTITIPKTLEKGPWSSSDGPFTGTTKLTSVTLENGMTKIASRLLQDCTGVTSITIPNSVTEIDSYAFANTGINKIELPNSSTSLSVSYSAFEGCSNLSEVNLGGITSIGANTFKDCPKLTTITIPKTLEKGPWSSSDGPFTGTTKLTSVTLENGMRVIGARLLQGCDNVTNITIPNTVTTIDCHSFENTSIKEISIPNSVEKIAYNAFDNCEKLEKITILDTVKYIGNSTGKEDVFKNHNKNLTIYCYENSVAAEYAIKYNIKYVYLTKPTIDDSTDNKIDKKKEQNQQQKSSNIISLYQKSTNKDDTTIATGKLPQTGLSITIVFGIISIAIISVVFYKKYNNYKDVK